MALTVNLLNQNTDHKKQLSHRRSDCTLTQRLVPSLRSCVIVNGLLTERSVEYNLIILLI